MSNQSMHITPGVTEVDNRGHFSRRRGKTPPPCRRHVRLKNASLAQNDRIYVSVRMGVTVLFDNTRIGPFVRKILYGVGYRKLRPALANHPSYIAADDNGIDALLVIDVTDRLDDGYPVPSISPARAQGLAEVASTYVDEHFELSALRVDHVCLPDNFVGEPVVNVTVQHGIAWGLGHTKDEFESLANAIFDPSFSRYHVYRVRESIGREFAPDEFSDHVMYPNYAGKGVMGAWEANA